MKTRSILLVSWCLLSQGAQSAELRLGNLSPAEALQAFETETGFSVTLVAAEPLTVDPVALAFDGRGRLYVAEDRDYPVGALNPSQREQLPKAKDSELRTRAEKLLSAPGGNREEAFAESKAALSLKPVPSNGHTLFQKNCAVCHRLNQEGVAVGPDLFGIRNQPKESILYHVIVPEAEIAPNFVNYECETRDGRVLSGLLAAESFGDITLRMAQGVEEIIPRVQIARLAASRLSLMPQEFEKIMPPQELADLLANLRGEE